MAKEPANKRAVCFIDGQNLFHSAKAAFGFTFPNYDVSALARYACGVNSWNCAGVRFYTGVPDAGTIFGPRRVPRWEEKALSSSHAASSIATRKYACPMERLMPFLTVTRKVSTFGSR